MADNCVRCTKKVSLKFDWRKREILFRLEKMAQRVLTHAPVLSPVYALASQHSPPTEPPKHQKPTMKTQVYANEKVVGIDLVLHKLCFRCTTCSAPLQLRNFVASNNAVYCKTHVPMPTATVVADALAVVAAVNSPKKASEGLKKTTLVTGVETIGITLGALDVQNALLSPKPQLIANNAVQKGDAKDLKQQQVAEIVNAGQDSKLQDKGVEILKTARIDDL